jgi:protein-S-isoprenylcysteine O-methyltransferase Ste14
VKYAIVFMTWVTATLLYVLIGALLIPWESQVAFNRCPKDLGARLANALWYAVPLSWFLAPVVPSFEERLLGVFIFACGATLMIWTRISNPFYLPVLREPRRIVAEGPYKFIDHPGYFACVAMADGSWLMLGHWMAAVPLGAYIGFLFARAQKEDRILSLKSKKETNVVLH